jgi:hypothetical protein
LGGRLELDAIFLFEDHDELEGVDGVKAETFAEERGIDIDILGGEVLEVQGVYHLLF